MIDEVGGISQAFAKLHELIDERQEQSRKEDCKNK